MARKIQFDDEPIVEINITPLVDIVLVLLVIFMVTAQFIVGRGINLELPTSKSSEVLQKQNQLTISILKDSTLILDGKQMQIAEIQKYINKKFKDKNLVSVVISADKSVPYNSLVQIMDVLRLMGVSNFALQMSSSPSKSGP